MTTRKTKAKGSGRGRETMKSFFGGLGIILCGMILAVLMSQVPVGFSDAEAATIGRKFYYGLPWPCYVAEGSSSLSALGQTVRHYPVNAMFWTAIVALVSCIPGRKVNWRRIFCVLLVDVVLFVVPAAYVWISVAADSPHMSADSSDMIKVRKYQEDQLRRSIMYAHRQSNPNGLTVDDLDMTGWEEADRKRKAGDAAAMRAFYEAVWQISNEKKRKR